VITNVVSDSYQYIYVIAHIICNHPVCLTHSDKSVVVEHSIEAVFLNLFLLLVCTLSLI